MNSRIQYALLCLGVLALVIFVFLREPKFTSQEVEDETKILLSDLRIEDIHTLVVKNRHDILTIEKHKEHWFIKEREAYQASTLRMNEILNALAELRVSQITTVEPSKWGQLGVLAPRTEDGPDSGCRVDLFGNNGYHRAIIVGNLQASGSEAARMFGNEFDGRSFVRIANNDSVYLVEQTLSFFNTVPSDWMLNILSNPHAYKRITYFKEGAREWSIARNNRNEPYQLYDKLDTNGRSLPNLTTTIDYSFSSMFIRDALPKEQEHATVGIHNDHYFELSALDGFTFRIYLGNKIQISEQERELSEKKTGVLRKVRASAYRHALLDWNDRRILPAPEEPPYANRIYLIDCPPMDDLMISYNEMLVFERMSPASRN